MGFVPPYRLPANRSRKILERAFQFCAVMIDRGAPEGDQFVGLVEIK